MTKIITQDPSAAQQTVDDMGTAKLAATHEAGLADERARAVAQQTAGVSAVEAALEDVSRDVKKRALEREKTLTGSLSKK